LKRRASLQKKDQEAQVIITAKNEAARDIMKKVKSLRQSE
jgi:hypothetical protein